MARDDTFSKITGYGEGSGLDTSKSSLSVKQPSFVKMIVYDVITDPNNDLKDPTRKIYWDSWNISNVNVTTLMSVVPRNTIIAKRINSNDAPMMVLPFFPSHLSLPCKPGECVWVLFENPEVQSEAAYWFCKTTDSHTTDDVNHTHVGRTFESSMFPGTQDIFVNEKSGKNPEELIWHELRNSPVVNTGEERASANRNKILKGEPDDIFETLILNSDASKITTYESVPRFRKRPGDIVLEGSNNTLIALGTDRVGPAAEYVDPETDADKILKSKIPKIPDTDLKGHAGSIDIVAGRGQTDAKFGKEASTTLMTDAQGLDKKGTEIKKEIIKSIDLTVPGEGDPDLINDRSRVLVSQRTKADTNFGISAYNSSKVGVSDNGDGDAAIVIKSDKIRLIARSDVQIIVTNFAAGVSPTGESIKIDEADTKKWASITIKSTGDIIFTPSDLGYIKLGGDDANLGIVCTDAPVTLAEGTTAGGPVSTPAGGPFATTVPVGPGTNKAAVPGMGKLASKVLIK